MWPTGPSRWQDWGSKPCSSVKPRADGPGSKRYRRGGGSVGIGGVVLSAVARGGAGICATALPRSQWSLIVCAEAEFSTPTYVDATSGLKSLTVALMLAQWGQIFIFDSAPLL